jgi:F-type H+-transporting ATPase subunit gamma
LVAIARQLVHYQVYHAQLQRAASEQASRVMAMESATTNLKMMEKALTLQRNRARQATITNELTEIVSGAETLA